MPRCNINLAEGIIWPRWKRLMAYRMILTYLLVMALLLLVVIGRAIQKIHAGAQYRQQSQQIQKDFTQLHPASSDLLDHAQCLKKQLEVNAARIESINDALSPSIYTPLPALILLANQPDKGLLHKFSFSQQTQKDSVKLSFDLVTPVSSVQNPAKFFLKQWQDDLVLVQQFPEIKQLQVRCSELASGPVFITQYEALTKE